MAILVLYRPGDTISGTCPVADVGVSVHTVARITALAHGGQILISRAALAPELPPEITVVELGEHHLRGLGAHALFQLSVVDLPGEFPPLAVPPRA